MQMGSGSHVYDIAEGWGELPDGIYYGFTHGIVVDSQDRVYVHNTSRDAVIVFDREGNFLHSWGREFADGAHGMYLSKEGDQEFLYLADYVRHIVVKTTLDGEVMFTLRAPNLPDIYADPSQFRPTDAAVAPNGDIYICDGYGQSWIHQYNRAGEHIRSFGGRGSEPGKLNLSHGLWVDTRKPDPFLYVADRSNHRIQVFTMQGEHVKFITEDIGLPCCLYQYEDELYIPDLRSRVTILDRNDQLIVHLGEDQEAWKRKGWPRRPSSEWKVDKFVSPHAVCVDSHGDVYVAEWVPNGRVTKLIRRR